MFDIYRDATMKQDTRDRRGTDGMRTSIRRDTSMQRKLFKKILPLNENKNELFQLVSDSLISQCNQGTIVCTKDVVTSVAMLTEHLQPWNQEEAGVRLFIHVNDAARNGLRRITIAANDTDIVVIALYIFSALKLDELWIVTGVGKNQRWLPINQYAAKLGDKVSSALPYQYASTGCDTVSSFAGSGKKQPGTHGKHTLRQQTHLSGY